MSIPLPLTSTIAAVRRASGVGIYQAKTVVYYAVATFLNTDLMPILAILGKAGTGKSTLMEMLAKLVNKPRWANTKTRAALRAELCRADTFTALIEEGDSVDEDLIANRYSKGTAQIAVRMEGVKGWSNTDIDIFGATIVHRRRPFTDVALRSRSIIVRTSYRPGNYEILEVGNEEIKRVAGLVREIPKTSHRIENTWGLLIAVAKTIEDGEYLAYAEDQIKQDKQSLVAGQSYEPEKALVFVLRALMVVSGGSNEVGGVVLISSIKTQLHNNFDLYLKAYQIEEMCVNLGFKVTHPSGYPTVQPNLELIKELIIKESREG